MKLTRPTSSLERFVLVLGLASSVCLAVAAFAAFGSPHEAGWSHLNDLAASIRANVRAGWSAVTADVPTKAGEPVCLEPASDVVHWTRAQAAAISPRVEPIAAVPIPGLSAFDALHSESERADIERHKLDDALSLAEEAAVKEADAAWLAQARLRTIQLAARLERPETVRKHWGEARAHIDPHIVTGDTSTLLLCLLAALPSIDAGQRAADAEQVVESWTAEQLPVPGGSPRMERTEGSPYFECASDPRESALRARLLTGCEAPREWTARFDEFDTRRRREALRAMVGSLPVDAPADAWTIHPAAGELLAVRATTHDSFRGHMLLRSTLERAMRAELEERHALPEGFALDLSGDASALGEPVGAWLDLAPAFPRATVRNPDVASILRGAESRTLWLRGGLIVLALFVAGASVATSFALRRERRLVEARTSFVAGVSHELRTPLASILLMAENLESGRAGANLERYHASIKREALRLRRLVDDVLDFSRLERGKRFEARIEDVDPSTWFQSVAAEAAEACRRSARDATIRLHDGRQERASGNSTVNSDVHFTSTHGVLAFSGGFDREALRRAVLNLIDNALRHSGATSILLHAEMSAGGTLVLQVADDGTGIPLRQRGAVFEPFTRLSGSESTSGTGLGLAIVREIAIAHGGTVSVRDPNEGPGVMLEMRVPIGTNPPLHLDDPHLEAAS